MTIIDELEKRSKSPSDLVKIELKLYNLADDLEKKARNHLKRISNVLPEFDIHDEKHSEKVEFNIEKLLEKNVQKLSTYELFLIHLSCFFHDCAMALSDWEINVLKSTEGIENFKNDQSVNNDLKEPFKITHAKKIIRDNKSTLYGKFDSDVKKWMFSPNSEEGLIEYLASMLIEYQNFRNGFAEQIRKVNSKMEFENLNSFIRTDYIRATHHIRIQTYVNNLDSEFARSFEQPAWGKKLAKDLALVCRSHGEDVIFLENLNSIAQYYGNESANLQLVAMLLRLGDIIHFSFDRAPIELRSSKLFKSEFSFLQWALKNNGANYSIENGKISFRAYCETPEIYFKLHNYLDWIEIEIQNYFKLDRLWDEPYKNFIPNLQDKIERNNISNDEKVFLPKRGLSFTLNQNRIIELLMGVGLYKDQFASLRELYQNSLDACRCMISEANSVHHKAIGLIQFKIEQIEDRVYLCCKDNGIGMTKEVIENYLLKIGNSYYKSSDFYRKQALWGGSFTPTSQFGIGILSCFMLGTKIEIVTKTKEGDYVSCAIEGPHENFYYKTTTVEEKELILESGTMVKVLLSDNIVISNKTLEKVYLLLGGIPNYFPDQFKHYKEIYKNWNSHLYRIVNSFVTIIPDEIRVEIVLEDGNNLSILSKPILPTNTEFKFTTEDFDFLDFLNDQARFLKLKINYSEIKDFLETYEINIDTEFLQYRTTLTLPRPGSINPDFQAFYSPPIIGSFGICIDGVSLSNGNSISSLYYYTNALARIGILNFMGENKPQLTVDRTSIVSYPEEFEKIAENISKILIQKLITITRNHISKHNMDNNDSEYDLLWKFIFKKVGFADSIFINELSNTDYGNILWAGIEIVTQERISIREFLNKEIIEIKNFHLSSLDIFTEKLILFKLTSANRIDITNDSVICESNVLSTAPLLNEKNDFIYSKVLIKADSWAEKYKEYDIVSSLFPLIPEKLFNVLDNIEGKRITNRVMIVHSYSNGITAFFDQDPLLVNEKLGLYISDSRIFEEEEVNKIYQFDKRRSNFSLREINDYYGVNKSKHLIVITAFIAPRQLSEDEKEKLEQIKVKDLSYYNGVTNGWSILVTGREKYNLIISSGVKSRRELSSNLPDDFWEENKDICFKYLDGEEMKKS